MFYALPAETVFEAKERTRRATFYLFALLVLLYVFFADLLAVAACVMFNLWIEMHRQALAGESLQNFWVILSYSTLAAALLAVAHFVIVRRKSLDDMLEQIQARPADEKDQYHQQFIHIVQEAEAAIGIQGIQAVVLSNPGCNAFSLQDGKGQAAIGATEGLLSKLNRGELSAVVAHEAAHLVHEDSRLVTTACFLFAVFGQINQALGDAMQTSSDTYDRRSSRGGSFWVIILVLWLISGLGYLVTRLISMAISREREYLADADGVAMCKDPLALAEGLYKISHRYRGNVSEPFSALFILNPADSVRDEQEGFVADLFSNHPPISERLSKILAWAKSDLPTLESIDKKEEVTEAAALVGSVPAPTEAGFMAYRNNQWVGPYSSSQLLTMGFMTPATWVCPAGSQQVTRASEFPGLLPIFAQVAQGMVSLNACPRCKTPLMTTTYESAEVQQCSFCKGYLLGAGVLERLISRDEVIFSSEEIKKAKIWRDSQKGPLKDRDHFPEIKCPLCGNHMAKSIHSVLTQVVVDHCSNEKCGAIWCDGGELETIQMIIQDAHVLPVKGA